LPRKAVEFLDGNYPVTYANGSTIKTWMINNGKVTATDKGSLLLGQYEILCSGSDRKFTH
jgi:hypothetical protein